MNNDKTISKNEDPEDIAEKSEDQDSVKRPLTDEERIKQLNMVVCICKGIPLKSMLKALKSSNTIEEVNRKTGAGTGGCRGQRCGPRIKILLKKKKPESEQKKS